MSEYDVRDESIETITNVVFADIHSVGGVSHAFKIKPWSDAEMIVIADEDYDGDEGQGFVVISSVEHAKHLIKALDKAISLGWIK